MVAERFCQQMDKTPEAMLDYLKSRGCKIGGVTQGERGVLWYDESGEVRTLPALPVPPARVRDTSGAGDVFHGAYVYSYLKQPVQRLGGAFPVCPARRGLQDPASRQRGRPADARRDRARSLASSIRMLGVAAPPGAGKRRRDARSR